jgi:thiamine pyrophosphokinase
MKSAVVFIHSRYPKSQVSFYRKLTRSRFKIAVNGGYEFFKRAKIRPDIVIGDFDSLKKSSVRGTRSLSFPQHKDKTDAELALEYCVKKKFKSIDIVMPAIGEPDHFMGLISLLANPKIRKLSVRIVNHKLEIKLLKNELIKLTNCVGHNFSVKAVCNSIKLTCAGTRYEAKALKIEPWQTTGLRNVVVNKNAVISIKGRGLFFHYHEQRN